MSAFKYRGRDSESVARRSNQSSGAYDSYTTNVPTFKPSEGENIIRIMPRTSQEDFEKWGDHWGIDVLVHYGVGPDNGAYLCLDKMKGEPCPICEARASARTEEEADALRPTSRIMCWLIDRKEEKAGPKLWSMPLNLSKDISHASQVKGSGEILLIDHPDEGYDVYFDREGEKLRTKYKRIEVDRNPSPLADDPKQQKRWLDYIEENPLPELLNYFPAEHIEKVLFGQVSARKEPEPEDGGEAPARPGRTRPSREPSRESSRGEPAPWEGEERSNGRDRTEERGARPLRVRGRPSESVQEDEGDPSPPPARERVTRLGREEPDPEPAPEPERSPRGRRSVAAEDENDGGGDDRSPGAARARLARLGRR
jgi:gp32 DNA binding protein like